MTLKKLLGFVEKEHQRLMRFYRFRKRRQLRYPNALKVMEEIGELCEVILAKDAIQRVRKLNNKKYDVGQEFADAIITLLILAENMGVDIEKELGKGIKKREKRNY